MNKKITYYSSIGATCFSRPIVVKVSFLKTVLLNITMLVTGCMLLGISGCKVYSFTGASIPADIHTFSVELFNNRSNSGPASLPQTITDKIKQKFQTEANLKQVTSDGDIQFRGA